MLDALCFEFGSLGVEPEGDQKGGDRMVPHPALLGEFMALGRKPDRTVRPQQDETLRLQATQSFRNTWMSHAKPGGNIRQSSLAILFDKVQNDLNVVLGELGAVLFANAGETMGTFNMHDNSVLKL
jgi:hypothetical protein